jgi:hypothetical protein
VKRAALHWLVVVLVVAAGAPRSASGRDDALPQTPPEGLEALIREAFGAHLRAHRDELLACHAEAGERLDAPFITHLVWVVRAFPDGAATARIVDRTREDRRFERCLVSALGAARFPPLDHDRPRSILYDLIVESDGPVLPMARR